MAFGDDLLAMIKTAKEAQAIKRTRCPVCEYPLEETKDGVLHCRFCGWSEGLGG